jgi:parallel beta-helix repeat protein
MFFDASLISNSVHEIFVSFWSPETRVGLRSSPHRNVCFLICLDVFLCTRHLIHWMNRSFTSTLLVVGHAFFFLNCVAAEEANSNWGNLVTAGSKPKMASPVPNANAYYVSSNGSDSADGSNAHPFFTLGRAKVAMESNSVHTTYVEAGTYSLSSVFTLTAKDSGMTLKADSGQVVLLEGMAEGMSNLIVLDDVTGVTIEGLNFVNTGMRGAAVTLQNASGNKIIGNHFTNTGEAILLVDGASNNTISGNEMDDSITSAVEVKDGSNNNVLDSNLIDGVGNTNTKGGGFFLHGVNGNKITHNLIENTSGMGIGISNWDKATINVGNLIEYNIVLNSDLRSSDSGSIYMLGRSHIDTQALIAYNFVDGTGPSHGHSVGIYLDDSTSGVKVFGNIVRNVGSDAVQFHGGDNLDVRNNILDIGSGRATAAFFQSAPADTNPTNTMLKDTFSQNIIYSTSMKPRLFVYLNGGQPAISKNLFFNVTGASMQTDGPTRDSDPITGDPKFAAPISGNYALALSSAASSIGFQPIDQNAMGLHPTSEHWYPFQ